MNEKKMTKIMIGAAVVIALATGGFAIYNHSVNAKEAVAKQEVMANIEKQQAQEEAAQQAKAKDPKVDESNPARYAAPANQATATEKTQSAGTSSDQKIPTQTPATTTTPPAQPKATVNQDAVPAITSLSNTDIQRLQAYPTYGKDGQEGFQNFNEFYADPHNQVQDLPNRFSPATLSVYNKAKVGWLTSPKLIYCTVIGQIAYRGVLTITYYGENSFGLTPNVTYQRDVEYRLENSVETGFAYSSTHYLSDFRAVK